MSSKNSIVKVLKTSINSIGTVLAIAGVIFVSLKLKQYWQADSINHVSVSSWMVIGMLSICYAGANIFLVIAWKNILEHYNLRVASRWAFQAYGISQLAKYVPGNIFHIAGRQAIAMAAGLPGKLVLKSNLLELIMISCGGTLIGWIVLSLLFPNLSLIMALTLLVCSYIGVILIARLYFSLSLSKAIIYQLLFLLSSAFIFTTILTLLVHGRVLDIPVICTTIGVYTIAWLAGLVMPGAPAGIGIRELVVVYFLSEYMPNAELLLAVLLGRIVTVIGDILFFLAAYLNKSFKLTQEH
jgi:uncharacterized membrane protein YbhN (UPF0104 family)